MTRFVDEKWRCLLTIALIEILLFCFLGGFIFIARVVILYWLSSLGLLSVRCLFVIDFFDLVML
jgi:hypothetical protein